MKVPTRLEPVTGLSRRMWGPRARRGTEERDGHGATICHRKIISGEREREENVGKLRYTAKEERERGEKKVRVARDRQRVLGGGVSRSCKEGLKPSTLEDLLPSH